MEGVYKARLSQYADSCDNDYRNGLRQLFIRGGIDGINFRLARDRATGAGSHYEKRFPCHSRDGTVHGHNVCIDECIGGLAIWGCGSEDSVRTVREVIMNKTLKDPGIIFGLACVLLIAVLGIFAPLLAPQNPNSQILEFRHKPPGFKGEIIRYRLAPELPEISMALQNAYVEDETIVITDLLNRQQHIALKNVLGGSLSTGKETITFWLGTDQFGRDILSRIIHGARISLTVGFSASIIALVLGVLLGALSGMSGGRIDTIIMRCTNIMFGFPTLLFLIGITAALEPSLNVVFLAVGLVTWPGMARLVRGQVLQLKEQEYVQSAKALGFSKSTIL